MKKLMALVLPGVLVLTLCPVPMLAQAQATGVLTGTATSNTGRRLPGLTIQLRNQAGALVGSVVSTDEGTFNFAGLGAGIYTIECLGTKKEVIGTAKGTLVLPTTTQNITCAFDAVAAPFLNKKVLTALGAAAIAIGTAAVVATQTDGSPSN